MDIVPVNEQLKRGSFGMRIENGMLLVPKGLAHLLEWNGIIADQIQPFLTTWKPHVMGFEELFGDWTEADYDQALVELATTLPANLLNHAFRVQRGQGGLIVE